jgi:hypothetical protein
VLYHTITVTTTPVIKKLSFVAVTVWYNTVYYYLAIIIHDNFYVTEGVVTVIVWNSTVYYYLAIIIRMTTSLSRGLSWTVTTTPVIKKLSYV